MKPTLLIVFLSCVSICGLLSAEVPGFKIVDGYMGCNLSSVHWYADHLELRYGSVGEKPKFNGTFEIHVYPRKDNEAQKVARVWDADLANYEKPISGSDKTKSGQPFSYAFKYYDAKESGDGTLSACGCIRTEIPIGTVVINYWKTGTQAEEEQVSYKQTMGDFVETLFLNLASSD